MDSHPSKRSFLKDMYLPIDPTPEQVAQIEAAILTEYEQVFKLDHYVAKGIIVPVTDASEWAAPLVVIQDAKSGKIRLCVDHTRLNKFVLRPNHPTRTPRDAVVEVDSKCHFYTSFDAANGYYQIPLHPSSQHLTTFMTPWGRYKFLRASMGLSCSGDEYNRRADAVFSTISNTVRVVDDLLRFDRTFPEHVAGVCDVLQADETPASRSARRNSASLAIIFHG